MNTLAVTRYNYKTHADEVVAGTEDWLEVAELGDGGGYDWTTFKAFYSPSRRRYFWLGDSGCSCNYWAQDIDTAADFEDGDRAALLRAWETFAKENEYGVSIGEYTSGVTILRNFQEAAA